jgi:hypothetical protein
MVFMVEKSRLKMSGRNVLQPSGVEKFIVEELKSPGLKFGDKKSGVEVCG